MKVKRSKFGNYQVNCANKKQDGNWDNYYLQVNIPKELIDTEEFDIEYMKVGILGKEYNAFMSNFARKDGTLAPKLVIFEKHKQGFATTEQEIREQDDKFTSKNINDFKADDLDFY